MNRVHFIYAPRSGDCWLPKAGPRDDIKIPLVLWHNRSAHAYGHLVSVFAASPKEYWRGDAQETATFLAQRMGGVAWDVQGQVNLLVPNQPEIALAAMWATAPQQRTSLGESFCLGIHWEDARTLFEASRTAEAGLWRLLTLWGWNSHWYHFDWRWHHRPAEKFVEAYKTDERERVRFSSPWDPARVFGGREE